MTKEEYIDQFLIHYDYDFYINKIAKKDKDALMETVDYYPKAILNTLKVGCYFGLDWYDKYPTKHDYEIGIGDIVIRSMLIPKEYHFEKNDILKDFSKEDIMKLCKKTLINLSMITTIIETAYKFKVMDGDMISGINFITSCDSATENIDNHLKIRFYTKKDKIWNDELYNNGVKIFNNFSKNYMEEYNKDKLGYLNNYILKNIKN